MNIHRPGVKYAAPENALREEGGGEEGAGREPFRMPHTGQAGVNQLGGIFVNGRPLPSIIRRRIVELAELGVRPCDISRQLLVSHGCVSKILTRYHETGSVNPGAMGGHKIKSLPPLVIKRILQFKRDNPQITSREVRHSLVYFRIYDEANLPGANLISKILRSTLTCEQFEPHRESWPSYLVAPRAIRSESGVTVDGGDGKEKPTVKESDRGMEQRLNQDCDYDLKNKTG